MASTLQALVEDYIGSVTDTTALTDWLNEGAKVVLDSLPEEVLYKFTSSLNVPYNGVSVAEYRVIKVLREGKDCIQVSSGLDKQLQNDDSIHYPTADSPVYLIKNGTLKVYPTAGYGATGVAVMDEETSMKVISVGITDSGQNYSDDYTTVTFTVV